MTGPTITIPVHFDSGRRGSRVVRAGTPRLKAAVAKGRVPRVTRLMALAIRIDEMVRSGAARDYAELARGANVTRARMSQIASLTLLAPDIIEAILDLPLIERGRDPISERDLRPIVAQPNWAKQRELWRKLSRGL